MITKSKEKARQKHAAQRNSRLRKWGALAAAGAVLTGSALYNHRKAKQAERDNPPLGRFLEVDGVRVHYLERGQGDPIVLVHGNGTMIEDWIVSGLFDELAKSRRVIAFDRPGFGHSDRPRSHLWTPSAQADLLAAALHKLDVRKPLVVAHSFGSLVAVALALDHPDAVSKLVLLGGYYYPSVRADVLVASQPAIPITGDVMRYTVSPLIGAAMMPRIEARIFNPAPVPGRWREEFPTSMSLRPSQIRAEAEEAGMMIPAAAALGSRYAELNLPLTLVAGEGDELVETGSQTRRLHEALPQSRFVAVEGAGHMVHHSALEQVLAAIRNA